MGGVVLTFGDRLREARLEKGLTQEQLAKEIGVAKSTLTGYEKGNREPDVFKIRRILEILDIDSDYLFGISRKKIQKANTETNQNPHTEKLLSDFYQLNETGQEKVLQYVEDLVCSKRYQKNIDNVKMNREA